MNRKLLNGLLVLAVAAGGVGTFTSCKDESFVDDVRVGDLKLQAQIDAIRGVTDGEFRGNLENWLDGLTGKDSNVIAGNPYNWTYAQMVEAAAKMYQVYDQIVNGKIGPEAANYITGIYDWIAENKIPEESWYKQIYLNEANQALQAELLQNLLSKQVTSIGIAQTKNPVFGTINLPIGLNSTVLATYVYNATGKANGMSFPADASEYLAGIVANAENQEVLDNVISGLVESITLKNGSFTDATEEDGVQVDGNMGNAYVTINPTNVDFSGITLSLIDGNGKEVLADGSDLVANAWAGDLNFGVSRGADNGLYKVQFNAPQNYEALGLKFDFSRKGELLEAVKNAIKDRTVSDIAKVGEVIYRSMENFLPAYALKATWKSPELDANGEVVTTETYYKDDTYTTVSDEPTAYVKLAPKYSTNSVVSNFELAATVAHPLSYDMDLGAVAGEINKRLPKFGPLTDYLSRIQNKLTVDFKDVEGVDYLEPIKLTVEFEQTSTFGGYVIFTYYDVAKGEYITDRAMYTSSTPIEVSDEFLQSLSNAVLEAAGYELTGELNKNVIDAINSSIDGINKQLQDYEAQLDEINSTIEKIKNNRKLDYAQKLVDIYNKIADKINHFLDNPNNYLQVMMGYQGKNGPHRFSTLSCDPTPVPASAIGKNGLEIFVSSYTGDIVVPSYKKYVAITEVAGDASADLKSVNASAQVSGVPTVNQIISGKEQRIAMNVDGLVGKTLRLSYVSVDYHGVVSMDNYYITVK